MKQRMKLLCVFGIAFMMFICGCGKLGEESAEKLVQEHIKVKDSYKKVSYEIKDGADVSRLVYRAKNLMGVELEGMVYFRVLKDGSVEVISDDTIIGAKQVYEQNPQSLGKYTDAIINFEKELKKNEMTIKSYMSKLESVSRDGTLNGNFFAWQEVYKKMDKYNAAVVAVKQAWDDVLHNGVPDAIILYKNGSDCYKIYKGEMCIAAKEVQVELTGNYSHWNGSFKPKG